MKTIKDFYLQNRRFLCLYFLLYVLVYGFISLRFGMSVDDCSDLDIPGAKGHYVYLACGRWFVAAYRWVFGYGACPLASGIMAGVFLSISLVLQTNLLKLNSTLERCAYGVLYLCCIQWIWVQRFCLITDTSALACLMCTAAVILLRNPGWRPLLSSALLVCCAMAAYQIFFLYFVVLWLAVELGNCIRGEGTHPNLLRLARPAAVLVLAAVCWVAAKHIIIAISCVPQATLDGVNAYNSNMTSWPGFFELSMHDKMMLLGHHVLYSGLAVFGKNLCGLVHTGQWVYTTALLPAVLLVWMGWKRLGAVSGRKIAAYVASMLYLPFSVALILLWSWAPTRVFMAEPLVPAALWGIWLGAAHLRGNARAIAWAGIAFICMKGMYYGSILGTNEAYYFRTSMQELNHMYLRGQQVGRECGCPDCEIIIAGNTKEMMGYDEVARMREHGLLLGQASPYAFNNGTVVFNAYAHYERLPRLRLATPEEAKKYRAKLETMADWPSDNSVAAEDGIVLIRLGPPSEE